MRSVRADGRAATSVDGAEPPLERLLEREAQILERAAVRGRGRERAVDRLGELAWQIVAGALQLRQLAPDPPDGGGGRRGADGVDAAERLVDDERQRVQVGLDPHRAALALLGRHVGERAEHIAGAGERLLADQRGAAEVCELGRREQRLRQLRSVLRGVRHEHVLRLDVAVDDPARVGMRERGGERSADLQDLLVRERLLGDQPRERVAVDELGD